MLRWRGRSCLSCALILARRLWGVWVAFPSLPSFPSLPLPSLASLADSFLFTISSSPIIFCTLLCGGLERKCGVLLVPFFLLFGHDASLLLSPSLRLRFYRFWASPFCLDLVPPSLRRLFSFCRSLCPKPSPHDASHLSRSPFALDPPFRLDSLT